MLRVTGDEAPLSWQLSEYKAGLWIEPTNPYSRDRYASTLLSMGRTDEGLSEITRSVAESPSMKTHEYLKDDSFLRFSAAEQSAVEEGFKQAIARGYPEAVNGLAGFYTKLNRFEDQGRLYEEAALKEADSAKKAELLVNAGLAYLKEAGSREQRAGSETQRVAGKEVSAKGKEQNIEKIRNSESSILPSALTPSQSASASELRAPSSMLHAAAERLFRNAIAANPTDARAYQQLIMILAARKDLAGAKEIISQGIKNGAPALPLYLSLAAAAQKGGSPEETKAALDSAKAEVVKLIKNGESPYTLYIALADGSRRAGARPSAALCGHALAFGEPLFRKTKLRPRSALLEQNCQD
ncbi:MAG: hypothetical protein DME76_15430 [Verrucomicrobia bacterium]|nr:MAG: hypothetical protein DME76_15430 [Verrucomicrobiota bacterium]